MFVSYKKITERDFFEIVFRTTGRSLEKLLVPIENIHWTFFILTELGSLMFLFWIYVRPC